MGLGEWELFTVTSEEHPINEVILLKLVVSCWVCHFKPSPRLLEEEEEGVLLLIIFKRFTYLFDRVT